MLNLIDKFKDVKVLVIGDAMIDYYHHGYIKGLSPEAPVPIFIEQHDKNETRRGGADNVAHQLEVLGCQVQTCFAKKMSIKHRYFAGHHQIFRRDSDQYADPSQADIDDAVQKAKSVDMVVLSDYAKGFLTHDMCQAVIHSGVPVIVDPKGRQWEKYVGCRLICPNHVELDGSVPAGFDPREHDIIEKRGAEGLRIYKRTRGYEDIPAKAKTVFDVTGAGDTVVSVLTAALASGANIREAAILANHAAGVVVGKLGTSVCTAQELRACITMHEVA